MLDSKRTLLHLPYFEELAQMQETDTAWKEVTAGLVTLRLVDAWISEGPHIIKGNSWSVTAVRGAIGEIDEGSVIQGLLSGVVDAVVSSRKIEMQMVGPRMMAYARALDFQARWTLAADVYGSVIRYTPPEQDSDAVIAAHIRLGFCLRNLNDLLGAAESYQTAEKIADQFGDVMGLLQARIGDAKIAMMRGNLPAAEAVLDDTIRNAQRHKLAGIHSMALHDRATVAGLRGDNELWVRLAYRALDGVDTQRNRDRILSDLAGAFYKLGVRSAARDAYLVLAATAQEQYLQWVATISLMEIAAADGAEGAFEEYRKRIEMEPLSPSLRAQFEHQVGMGYRRLGRAELAHEWLDRALARAQSLELHQLVFEIEAELPRVRASAQADARTTADYQPTSEIAEIAHAILEIRESAGVPG